MHALSHRHRLALRAALLGDERGRAAFVEWSGLVPLRNVDDAEFRILPLIYRRLVERGETPDTLPRLKGAYRHVWSHNTMLLGVAARTVRLLAEHGIDTLLLKGVVMFACWRLPLGPRFMRDIDVLVPRAHARHAARLLVAAGWKMGAIQIDQLSDKDLDWWPGAPLRHPDGYELDLHWQALHRGTSPHQDACFWDRSVAIEISGAKTRRLTPADQLYHALLHGARWTNGADLDTAVDACSLLEHRSEIDFSRILDHIRRDRSARAITAQLTILQEDLGIAVDFSRLARGLPVSWPERLAFNAYRRPAFVPPRDAASLVDYQRFLVREDLRPGARSALSYLCARGHVDRARHLPVRSLLTRPGVPAPLRRKAAAIVRGRLANERLPKIDRGPERWAIDNGETSPFVSGWSAPESGGRWSEGVEALLAFRDDWPRGTDVQVTMKFATFLDPRNRRLKLDVFANGDGVARWSVTQSGGAEHTFLIRARSRDCCPVLLLAIRIEKPLRPEPSTRLDQERRALGLFLQEIRFDSVAKLSSV